jgi:hypothetical protein
MVIYCLLVPLVAFIMQHLVSVLLAHLQLVANCIKISEVVFVLKGNHSQLFIDNQSWLAHLKVILLSVPACFIASFD